MSGAKENVALSSVFASAGMAAMKLVVGLATGSLGILAEALHSLLDLGAATLTFLAVRISDQPADEVHQYGHGKVESVSALIETGLLFLTAVWIVKEAVERLTGPTVHVEVTWYGVAVIIASIGIDIGRSRALRRVAKETKSQALEADALHFSTDILSSCVVLGGLGMAALGFQTADAVAAIGVAVFVSIAAWRLGKQTVDVLMDAAPAGIVESVTAFLAAIPDVVQVENVRARPAGATVFVEAMVGVNRSLSQEQVHALRISLQDRLRAAFPDIMPLLVAEPLALDDEAIGETVRIIAARQGLQIHDVGVVEMAGRRHLAFDLEVEETLTIKEAHDIACGLEERLEQGLGSGVVVDIHIDPRRTRVTAGTPATPATREAVESTIAQLAQAIPMVQDLHGLFLQDGPDGLYVSFHCVFGNEAPVRAVHSVSVQLEHEIMRVMPAITRVVVHAEPVDHVDSADIDHGGTSFCYFGRRN
jgi:cation diffusion facilitator family transporter